MRTIELATAFPRDHKRESKGRHRVALEAVLASVLDVLAADKALDSRLRDHALSGDGSGHRECHIRPALLLIYRKIGDDRLRVAPLGSHSGLFRV